MRLADSLPVARKLAQVTALAALANPVKLDEQPAAILAQVSHVNAEHPARNDRVLDLDLQLGSREAQLVEGCPENRLPAALGPPVCKRKRAPGVLDAAMAREPKVDLLHELPDLGVRSVREGVLRKGPERRVCYGKAEAQAGPARAVEDGSDERGCGNPGDDHRLVLVHADALRMR